MGDAVLVAGGTGALGAGVLRVLVDAGRPVTATYLEERERERVEAEFGAAVPLIRADLMDAGEVEGAVGAVVNLVGGFKAGPKVHETSVADWDELLTLNLRPGFLLARAAMPRLIAAGGGAYVGVSARPALKPFAGAAAYHAGRWSPLPRYTWVTSATGSLRLSRRRTSSRGCRDPSSRGRSRRR